MRYREHIIHRTNCCGIRELHGISDQPTIDVVYTVGRVMRQGADYRDAAHYMFSDNTGREDGYGGELRDYIREHNLGEVVQTEYQINPNSQHQLRAFLWTPDREAIYNWIDEQVAENTQRVLSDSGLEIGDFVRFTENTPNYFNGRAVILSVEGDSIQLSTQRGRQVSILAGELPLLTKTRPFAVN